jgi:hemerythrin-like domain-containing protein
MITRTSVSHTRRQLFAGGAAIGAAVIFGAWPRRAASEEHPMQDADAKETHEEDEVSPAEDLMREHGVLERVLLVYEASLARLAEPGVSLPVMVKAADITRRFIEDYHEKLEEEFLFPRFEKVGQQLDLVRTLRLQHQRGRALTNEIRRMADAGGGAAMDLGSRLREAVESVVRMYRPHAAREDTVLFPAFRALVPEKEYAELGEQFEEKEHALFGEGGFQTIVEQVAELEKRLGIYDLNRFTPG